MKLSTRPLLAAGFLLFLPLSSTPLRSESSPAAAPSLSNNRMLLRQIYDAFNAKDFSALDALIAPDVVDHNAPPGTPSGLAGVKQYFQDFARAFPDYQFTVEDMVAEGEKAAARVSVRGTHRGDFMGVSPTGKSVFIGGIDIVRFSNGKAVERWGVMDEAALLRQLGVTTTASGAAAR